MRHSQEIRNRELLEELINIVFTVVSELISYFSRILYIS